MTTSSVSNDIIPFNVSLSEGGGNVRLTRVRPLLLNDSANPCDISSLRELDITSFEPTAAAAGNNKRVSFIITNDSLSQNKPTNVITVGERSQQCIDNSHIMIDQIPSVSTFKKDLIQD